MKARHFILVGIIIVCINCIGKAGESGAYFTIERIEKDTYAIPLIKCKEHPQVADKINQVIQMIEVNKLYEIVGDKLFDEMKNEDGFSGTTSLDYNVLLNNNAVLSIQFNDETVAAYPDYHTSYLNFNSATGDLIDINELFIKSGIDHLNSLAGSAFNNSIKANYDWVLQDTSMDNNQRKENSDIIFQLTECNANYEIWKYGISDNAFVVEKDRCFPHAMQALDISWSCEIRKEDLFRDDLTPYGEKLLNKKLPDSAYHYNLKEREITIHGKIDNKYAFCMYLRIYSDNSVGGNYWYKKYGQLIELRGTKESQNKIVVTESEGMFEFILNENGSISGTWSNNKGEVSQLTCD